MTAKTAASPRPLRILDVGGHDGFVAAWIARRLSEKGVKVRVDGCDLNPAAVEAANERLRLDGLEGTYVTSAAEDIGRHFEPGTYDAVLAFELIEHVADVDALLAACERMCRNDGEVMISTPDGTYGEGGNPHHLRVYRSIDLVDLLRKRGNLAGAEAGTDGTVTVSYTPKPGRSRKEAHIYCGPGWERWSPHDIETKGLGGSETAAVRIADELSAAGWVVTVFGEVEPGAFTDVIYRHHSVYDPTANVDVILSSRMPGALLPGTPARKVLWMHDVDCGDAFTPDTPVDSVLVLSRWHRGHVRERYPWLDPSKLHIVPNGIHLPYFKRQHKAGKRAPRVLYTSSPDRGLDIVLEHVWPRVLKAQPDAELTYCYAPVYQAVAAQRPDIAQFRARCDELAAATENAHSIGNLAQFQLAELMRASRVWIAPSFNTNLNQPFHETFCIGALEAQAAGLVRVGSAWGALAERNLDVPVDAEPMTEAWFDALADGVVRGLTEQKLWQPARKNGPPAARKLSWKHAAQRIGAQLSAV